MFIFKSHQCSIKSEGGAQGRHLKAIQELGLRAFSPAGLFQSEWSLQADVHRSSSSPRNNLCLKDLSAITKISTFHSCLLNKTTALGDNM